MGTNSSYSKHIRWMCTIALLIAIELVMKMTGLGMVPIGPLKMSFLTLPVAVGAVTLGPVAGMIIGGVFGVISLMDAISGESLMTGAFFIVSPFKTVILCVVMRMLMGYVTGVIFRLLRKFDRKKIWSYYVAALSAALLNTLFFMGFIVLFFYNTEYVQNLAAKLGAANPLMFIVLLVGVQGLVEALACTIVGGTLGKVVSKIYKE